MLAPPRLKIDTFKDTENREIRYAFSPSETTAKAIITLLEGRAEPLEKYAELIKDFNDKGYACAIMDWPGQGKSYRNLPDEPEKHDTPSYDELLKALALFKQKIIPEVIIPQLCLDSNLPQILLGQSMGGHLGMHYLADNPNDYVCAVFSAPMVRFHPMPRRLTKWLEEKIVQYVTKGNPTDYIPGGGDWTKVREASKLPFLTSDEKRSKVLTNLFSDDKDLRTSYWTRRTLKEAFDSCIKLQDKIIETPCLVILGDKDVVINNQSAKDFAVKQPNMQVVEIEDGLHELHMERDELRDQFLEHTFSFIKKHGL